MVRIQGSMSGTILAVYFFGICLLCTYGIDNQNSTSTENGTATNNQTSTSTKNGTATNSSSGLQSDNCTSFTLSQSSCCEDFSNFTCDVKFDDDYENKLLDYFSLFSDDGNDCYYYDMGCRGTNPQDPLLEFIVLIQLNSRSCCFNGTNFVPQFCNGSLIFVEDSTNSNKRSSEMSISSCYNNFYEGNTRIYVRDPNKTSECCPCNKTCNSNSACGTDTCYNSTCNTCNSTENSNCTSTGTNNTSSSTPEMNAGCNSSENITCTSTGTTTSTSSSTPEMNTGCNSSENTSCTSTGTTSTLSPTPEMKTAPNTISTAPISSGTPSATSTTAPGTSNSTSTSFVPAGGYPSSSSTPSTSSTTAPSTITYNSGFSGGLRT